MVCDLGWGCTIFFGSGTFQVRGSTLQSSVSKPVPCLLYPFDMSASDFSRGNEFLRNGQLEEAIAAYQKAIGQNRDFYLAYQNLGEALEKLGRFDEAIAAYRRAVELKPEAAWSYVNLSRVLRQVGRVDEAEKAEEQGGGIHPKLGVVRSLPSDFSMNSTHQISSTTTAKNNNYSIPKSPSQSAPKKASPGRRLSHRKSQLSSSQNFLKPPHFTAQDFGERLWGGYSRYALPALEEIKHDLTAAKSERIQAAWELVRWYYVDGDYEKCLENIELLKIIDRKQQKIYLVWEVQCLIRLNQINQADQCVDFAMTIPGSTVVLWILKASTQRLLYEKAGKPHEGSCLQLDYINKIYKKVGLAPMALKDPQLPANIDNITAHAKPTTTNQKLKVSVIMPVYNAAETIHIALDSLLVQTWQNIEIIVVDDCSHDSTCDIVKEYVERDCRVQLIAKNVNEGTYPARNRGLAIATGDLIMVHDSDDWSHPQKIEYQIDAMNRNNSCVAVMSHWLRVKENLIVVGKWKPSSSNLFDLNFSSIMFKKEVLNKVGKWDDVKVNGDAEMKSRLVNFYEESSVHIIDKEVILSLAMSREDSLTRTKNTHVKTIDFGLRWHYRDAYNYWHSRPDFKESPKLSQSGNKFPVPLGNQVHKSVASFYDLIVISDFSLKGGAFVSTLNYIVAACKSGMKVAVVHWQKYDLKPQKLNPRFYDACVEYNVDILTPGDQVKTEFVLFGYPAIIQHKTDYFPQIETQKLIVIINQFASRLVDGSDAQYSPSIVRSHLKSMFGQEGYWIPISSWVQRLMCEHKSYPEPYPNPWYPMIDVEQWCRQGLRWRGTKGGLPVVGRHSRDAYTKWPKEVTALKQAYGVNQPWQVRLLGGAKSPIDSLGGKPNNWQVMDFNSVSVQDFLEDLDFYIHYPHEDYIEEFGRAIMEAMAVGIPVILAPQFRETFGDAALYSEPARVNDTIQKLWLDECEYIDRARIGRDFVCKHCDLKMFMDRINSFNSHVSKFGVK